MFVKTTIKHHNAKVFQELVLKPKYTHEMSHLILGRIWRLDITPFFNDTTKINRVQRNLQLPNVIMLRETIKVVNVKDQSPRCNFCIWNLQSSTVKAQLNSTITKLTRQPAKVIQFPPALGFSHTNTTELFKSLVI